MICLHCGSNQDKVTNSRTHEHKESGVWRRRECLDCSKRVTTLEITEKRYEQLLRAEQFTVRLGAFLDDIAKMNPKTAGKPTHKQRAKGAVR